jgi:hypothetical protein
MQKQKRAEALIERCSQYVEPNSFDTYKFWVASEEEVSPGISASIRAAALGLLSTSNEALLRSALQALAVTGSIDDVAHLDALQEQISPNLASEVNFAKKYLVQSNKSFDQLLQEVSDRESFVAFVLALADERERAERIEQVNPDRYRIDGALGWKNANISAFLYAGLSGLEDETQSPQLSWREFAMFLYTGKVYE